MKYVRSTSVHSYTIEGFTIPSMNGKYLTVTDSGYNRLDGNKVFSSLVRTGGIVVYHTKPSDMPVSNEELMRENEVLKQQLAAANIKPATDPEPVEEEVAVEQTVEEVFPTKRGKRGKK